MKIPTFPIIGGKARLRNWLLGFFPSEGQTYVEPFAGRGNVFFKAKQQLNFKKWHINDIQAGFLKALVSADFNKLPANIPSKTSWEYWRKRAEENDPLAHLLEPEITWGGKGWSSGARLGNTANAGKHGYHPPYNREKFLVRAEKARELMSGVEITSVSWEQLPWKEYTPQDFVYLDPPYHESATAYYQGNVDHSALLSMLTSASFRWALSGYETELYARKLGCFRKVSTNRNAEIKSCNTRKKETVTEFLWMNY